MQKELEMLRKRQLQQEDAEMQRILPAVASYLTELGLKEEDKGLKDDLFAKQKDGYWHPAKQTVARVMAQAAARDQQRMSTINEQRALLKKMIQEKDALSAQTAAGDNRKRVSNSLQSPGPTAPSPAKKQRHDASSMLPFAKSGGWGDWCTK